MKLTIFCKPNAKKPGVEKVDESTYRVAVRAAPEDGEANREVCRLLAGFFKVSLAAVTILAGQKSRQKIVAIKS